MLDLKWQSTTDGTVATCEKRQGPAARPERRGVRGEAGQVLVLFALLLPVLFAALAVLIDGSYLYGQRRVAQNAADAAVLAGALTVGKSGACDATASARADYLAQRNGAPNPALSYATVSSFTPAGGPSLAVCQVSATTRITTRPFLSGVIGRTSLQAGAAATAAVAGLATDGNDPVTYASAPLLPIALDLTSLQADGFGRTVERFAATVPGKDGFSWFVPRGSSCSDSAIDTAVTAATLFKVNAGDDVTRCAYAADSALHDLAARAPVLRTVAITSGAGGPMVAVRGFAAMYIEATQDGPGLVPSVFGYFVDVEEPTAGSIGAGLTPNYGVYGVELVR